MIVYAVTCQGETVAASTDYDAIFQRRAEIDALGECAELHPIVSGRFVAGVR